MRTIDLFLFGPPIVIVLWAWIMVRKTARESEEFRARLRLEQTRREGAAE